MSETQSTEAKLRIHYTRLKRQTLNLALGKFNISMVSTDSNTIKQKANKVYTDFAIETDGLNYIQRLFIPNPIIGVQTEINREKTGEKPHTPIRSRL